VLSERLLDILVCPRCHGDLRPDERQEILVCRACDRKFAIEQNIPIMIEPDDRPST
jgi:uncharacterized protein YbaR (Trm112 family)